MNDTPERQARTLFTTLEPVDLVTRVSQELFRVILEGRLKPGERLVEAEVARQLGVSRAPVREAARLLEERGLLVAHPRRGFFVRDLTLQEIDDLYGLRISLERFAGQLACDRMDDAACAGLERQLARLYELADGGDAALQVEEDLRFHLMICEISGNRRLLRVFSDLADEVRIVIALIGRLFDDPHRLANSHVPLFEALAARDRGRFDHEINYHIEYAWQEVRRSFQGGAAPRDGG